MNIAVVGGGTAGWLTALCAKKFYPEKNITVIESESIGILGAGESSVSQLIELFDLIDIPTSDLVKNCNLTIKNGNMFVNWSKNNKKFLHPFGSKNKASSDFNYKTNPREESLISFSHICSLKFDHSLSDYSFLEKLSKENKVPFIKNNKNYNNIIFSFDQLSSWSINFDAASIAKYLRKIAEQRGIKRVEGVVEKINCDQDGYIKSLGINDKNIKTDFVFDCTGFKRLIIGNFYKSNWKSYSEYLPINRAIPFFLPPDNNLPPYTESIAMNYGWMWKAPLQHRYGCGYVFDSNWISDDEAQLEIEKYLGLSVDPPKIFSFNAGRYEKIWIKNCLALGLASGFIEPLEASSLWILTLNLFDFFSDYDNINCKNQTIIDNFNKKYTKYNEDMLDFISLYYVTNKDNTDFWKYFTKNNKIRDNVLNILEIIKNKPLTEKDINNEVFDFVSWYYSLIGREIIDKTMLKKYYNLMKTDHADEYLEIIKNQNKLIPLCWSHKKFLEELKNG